MAMTSSGSSGSFVAMTMGHERSSSQSSLLGNGDSKQPMSPTKAHTFDMSNLTPEAMSIRMNPKLFDQNQQKQSELSEVIQNNQKDTKKDLAEMKEFMVSSQSAIMNQLGQVEANIKNAIYMEVEKMIGIMGAHFSRLFSELANLRAEVKKAQFSVELAHIRQVVRNLEDHFDQLVDQVIAASQVEDLPQDEYTEVIIEDRIANKEPYRIGDRVYFLNQNVLTISGQLGPQTQARFLGPCNGKSIGGTWKENIRLYVHNEMLSYVIEEILYYNKRYGLSLEIKEFTSKEMNRPPPMGPGTVADYTRAKLIIKGCAVCGLNLPTDPVKQKCQNCKGKKRSKAGICCRCRRWGYFGDGASTFTCVDCKPKGCCAIM